MDGGKDALDENDGLQKCTKLPSQEAKEESKRVGEQIQQSETLGNWEENQIMPPGDHSLRRNAWAVVYGEGSPGWRGWGPGTGNTGANRRFLDKRKDF